MGKMITNLGFIKILGEPYLETCTADVIKAFGASGLQLQDDGGNLGIFIEDGGQVGINHSTPLEQVHLLLTQDAATVFKAQNASTGSSAWCGFKAQQQANQMWLGLASTNYGAPYTNSVFLYSSAAIPIIIDPTGGSRMYFDNTGGVFISKAVYTNAKMTQGLTIDQGTNDDEILAFKSSEVAHSYTDVTEADTYGFFKKAGANYGGLHIEGVTDYGDGGAGLILVGTTTTSANNPAVVIRGQVGSGGGAAGITGTGIVILFQDATQELAFFDGGGQLTIGNTYTRNTKMTIGVNINQGSADNEILSFKSSAVAHGMTALAETDTYGFFSKYSGSIGGLKIAGLTESVVSCSIYGYATSADQTKNAEGQGNLYINLMKKSDAGGAAHSANENLIAVTSGSDGTVWILDADGDTWQSGGITSAGGIIDTNSAGISWAQTTTAANMFGGKDAVKATLATTQD
jgi:hypothetical protein